MLTLTKEEVEQWAQDEVRFAKRLYGQEYSRVYLTEELRNRVMQLCDESKIRYTKFDRPERFMKFGLEFHLPPVHQPRMLFFSTNCGKDGGY